jgi:hypothetical protein
LSCPFYFVLGDSIFRGVSHIFYFCSSLYTIALHVGDGTISKQEFRHGCEVLNSKLPPEQQVTDPDALLHMMDIDGNDGIDLNEFFEVFRLVDALDGKMDGQFDILKGT